MKTNEKTIVHYALRYKAAWTPLALCGAPVPDGYRMHVWCFADPADRCQICRKEALFIGDAISFDATFREGLEDE